MRSNIRYFVGVQFGPRAITFVVKDPISAGLEILCEARRRGREINLHPCPEYNESGDREYSDPTRSERGVRLHANSVRAGGADTGTVLSEFPMSTERNVFELFAV